MFKTSLRMCAMATPCETKMTAPPACASKAAESARSTRAATMGFDSPSGATKSHSREMRPLQISGWRSSASWKVSPVRTPEVFGDRDGLAREADRLGDGVGGLARPAEVGGVDRGDGPARP
jgi:hypothetical protein